MRKGILLDGDNNVMTNVKRDNNGLITAGLLIGDRRMQDVNIVLSVNQGEIKEDPVVGTNLLRMIRSKERREKMRKVIENALKRIGIRFDDIKSELEAIINGKNGL